MAQQSTRAPAALEGPFDPLTGEQVTQKPFAFPSPSALRLAQPQELARLKVAEDLPAQVLETMRNKKGHQRYINYPSRLLHLRPQSNLRMTDDLDWEKAFLWQRVSLSYFDVSWVQKFPCPGLDLPLEQFPESILKWGQRIGAKKATTREALDFAAAVLSATGRDPSEPAPVSDAPWRDVQLGALNALRQLQRRKDNSEAAAMATKVREHQRARDDYASFFRLRDSRRKPTGLGFRGTRDVLLLDDEYLNDFLRRAAQSRPLGRRKRSDVKLVSFLNSVDAGKVTTVAVSAAAFRDMRARTYLCYAVVRTFPNLKRLLLTSIGVDPRDIGGRLRPRRLADMRDLADREVRKNGGDSFLAPPREDAAARFDVANMSPGLIKATGAYADGRGRALAGDSARTPVVAYGVGAGLLVDPEARARGDGDGDGGGPPLVEGVQHALTAAFDVFTHLKETAAAVARAETLSKLERRRTMLPRPVRRGPPGTAAQPVERLYRRTEVTPEGFFNWVVAHAAKLSRRDPVPEELASETDPESEASLPAAEVGPATRKYARVESVVLAYNRELFDRNVRSGWTGYGPGVDMSHFGRDLGPGGKQVS